MIGGSNGGANFQAASVIVDVPEPKIEEYRLIHKTVKAIKYNGKTATAYDILAWIHRNGGTGTYIVDTNDPQDKELRINDQLVPKDSWVVCVRPGVFELLFPVPFLAMYELADKPVMR